MDRPCAPCSCQVLHSGPSPPHLAVFSFHVSRFPSVGMFDAGPALCQQAVLGAGQCSSTPPPAHLFPPATAISVSLIRTGRAQPCHPWSLPCVHAHTCVHCASDKPPPGHIPAQELPKMTFPLTSTSPCRPPHSPGHPGPGHLCPHKHPQQHCHQIQPSSCSVERKEGDSALAGEPR